MLQILLSMIFLKACLIIWISRTGSCLLNVVSSGVGSLTKSLRKFLLESILHANKGKHQIELLDVIGSKLKQVQLYYNGMGALESWNLGGLPAGQYILNIRQTHPVTGILMKKGAYKILKIN